MGLYFSFNPRRRKVKKVTRRHMGGGGGQSDPSPLLLTPFIIFGTYNERSLYFRFIEPTCCLIDFHGNHSNIMTSLAAAILDFQFFSKSNLNTKNSVKTTLAIGIYKIVGSTVKLSVFRRKSSLFFSKKLHFRCQHTSCVTYYMTSSIVT